jgi:hypothetical protein
LARTAPGVAHFVKNRPSASTHKKVIVELSDRTSIHGYINPNRLGLAEPLDLLTTEGEHHPLLLKDLRAVYFVREFTASYAPERKAFLSRPKLDGLWVRLTFHDSETLEGIVANDLLALLDSGVQITPPDLNGPTVRIFVPRTALAQMTVLGVVGIARRKPAAPAPVQPRLFSD